MVHPELVSECDKLWQSLDWMNPQASLTAAKALEERFGKGMFDYFKASVGTHYDLHIPKDELTSPGSGILEKLLDTDNIQDIRAGLNHAIDNLWQHGGKYGALLLMYKVYPNARMRFTYIMLDRGPGFVQDDWHHVHLHEAIQPYKSFRSAGRKGSAYLYGPSFKLFFTHSCYCYRAFGTRNAHYWKPVINLNGRFLPMKLRLSMGLELFR
jgi:hypothetical protein